MLQPLYGNVLLEKQKEESKTATGIILKEEKEKPSLAKVLAVGEGHYEDGKLVPLKVKEGDTVVFKKYSGTEFTYEKKDYLIVDEKDILAIIK
ncbi:MAG: co-chaperone GroES [Erysipelotrichales bacterium]|nr:co-chaperone GroES [Erysipelotrichales bacterium]